jgi:hypothetical protein
MAADSPTRTAAVPAWDQAEPQAAATPGLPVAVGWRGRGASGPPLVATATSPGGLTTITDQ